MTVPVQIINNRPPIDIIVEAQPPLIITQVPGVGPPGPASGDEAFAYVFVQTDAAFVWNINHNLNGFPNVTTVQLTGPGQWTEIEGDVVYLDGNNVQVTFGSITSGRAFLS